ncbi:hypothetical protein B0H17DRAFT_1336158 [Mycena rosella]|uniref:Myb/SANT-like domain-containing protein n=1 Tax=Mycena rosella TaxID=1033263 RepID=A0AAD7CWA2_MYCRO|nr:hypothetical protein B0H17DRAFT_1336158 [Mycena rosella]
MAKKDGGARCTWSTEDDQKCVLKICWAKDNGFQSESDWKPQTWAIIAAELKDTSGPTKTAAKIHDHWGNLKSNFNAVHALCGVSGFGWDEGMKMVTATDAVWDAYIQILRDLLHNSAKCWRKTHFPLYDDILHIVDGIVATGAGAFHAGAVTQTQSQFAETQPQSQSQSEAQSEVQSDATQSQSQPIDWPETPRCAPAPASTMHETPPDDDLTPSSPVHPCRKCASSASPVTDSSRKSKKRNAEAASEIAGALQQVANSLVVVGSPQVRRQAMNLMEQDADFVGEDSGKVMKLFARDTAVVQIYVASGKQTMRSAFICLPIDED